jgi:predicted dehydrogenase
VLPVGLARARLELTSFVREKDALIWTLLYPIILLAIFGSVFNQEIAPGVSFSQYFLIEYYVESGHSIPFVTTKEIGGKLTLYFVEVDYYHEIGPWWSGWRWGANTRKNGPTASLVAGCHAVDLMYLFGGDVDEVFAYGTWGHRKDYEYEPTYQALAKFKSGKLGKTGNSYENECPYVMNIIIHGSKGSVFNEKFFSKEWFPGQEEWQTFQSTMLDSGDVVHHPFKEMVEDFADALLHDREADANIHEAYKSHEICLAIDRSIETGEVVKLPLED